MHSERGMVKLQNARRVKDHSRADEKKKQQFSNRLYSYSSLQGLNYRTGFGTDPLTTLRGASSPAKLDNACFEH
jgi:hypothetical protein